MYIIVVLQAQKIVRSNNDDYFDNVAFIAQGVYRLMPLPLTCEKNAPRISHCAVLQRTATFATVW